MSPLRRYARATRRLLLRAVQRISIPLRYRYYVGHRDRRLVAHLPRVLREQLGLTDPRAVGSRRIEIGSGPHPTPGYIHVDLDPSARHLEIRAPAWKLPFPDCWADEILAVHSLEHVPPRFLIPTLSEWHRVLAPGGRVRIHVPNSPSIMESYLRGGLADKWRAAGALLGMYCAPGDDGPEKLTTPADHQILFDHDVLTWALSTTGFSALRDQTDAVRDRHTEAWEDTIPRFSLVMEATRS